MNTNSSSDKSSQPVNVKSEKPAVTRRTLLKGSAALAAAALGTHAGTSAIGASPLVGDEAIDIPGAGVSAGNDPARCRHRRQPARPDQGAGRAGSGDHPAIRRQGWLDGTADRGHAAAGLGRLRPVVQLGQDRLGGRGLPAGRRHPLAAVGECFSPDQSRQDQRRGQGRRRRRPGAAPLRPVRRLARLRPDRPGLDAAADPQCRRVRLPERSCQ